MTRAPVVKCNSAPPGAPDARVQEAKRGDAYRRIFIHYHAEGDQEGADVVVHVYRDNTTGVPVVEVSAAPAGTQVVTHHRAVAEAAAIKTVREVAKASEALSYRAPPTWAPGAIRCPHDGGACHHRCNSVGFTPDTPEYADRVGGRRVNGPTCFRKKNGMALTEPWDGFPVPGDAPVKEGARRVACAASEDFSAAWAEELAARERGDR